MNVCFESCEGDWAGFVPTAIAIVAVSVYDDHYVGVGVIGDVDVFCWCWWGQCQCRSWCLCVLLTRCVEVSCCCGQGGWCCVCGLWCGCYSEYYDCELC